MGRHFVLKDASGRLAGYLIDGGERVQLRVRGDEGSAVLALAAGGKAKTLGSVRTDDTEQVLEKSDSAIDGALLFREETLLFSTGLPAKTAFERMLRERCSEKRKAERAEKPDLPDKKVQKPEAEDIGQQENTCEDAAPKRRLPARRWPPPPCMPGAVYTENGWEEREQ